MAKKKDAVPYKLVQVAWLDAVSDSTWKDVVDHDKPHVCYSNGYLVAETPEYVNVAGTWSGGEINNSIAIPRGMIISIKPLKIGKVIAQHQVHTEPDTKAVHREPSKG